MESSVAESWNPVCQSSHTEGFLLAVAMEGRPLIFVQCQLININKLESGEDQHLQYENRFD
jgi:hypothetical protein